MMVELVNNLRPCKECDHIQLLHEDGKLCQTGMCRFTGRTQPIYGSWYCEHFKSGNVRMHPKVRFKGKKRRKNNGRQT